MVTYHLCLPNIGELLYWFQSVLKSSRWCNKAISEVQMVAYREPKCLRDYLVREELKPDSHIITGCFNSCKGSNCKVCNFLIEGDTFTSYMTKREYKINIRFNRNSKYGIYLVSCTCCGVHYIGSTITKFRVRFNNHKSKIRRHSRLT